MVAFFVSSSLRSILLVCYSLTPFWFRNEELKSALKSFHKGNELLQEGKYRKASRQFQRGIFLGRPIVLELQEKLGQTDDTSRNDHRNDITDNPFLALEWLTQAYLASSQTYIRLGDYDEARRDAWGACLLSNNNQAALKCMIEVCQRQNDKIGELSSLKMYLSAVLLDHTESSSYSLIDSSQDDEDCDSLETVWDLAQLETRVKLLQEELDARYSKQRNDTHVVDA
ncbi:MAG: hypothetical protein SGILL_003862 [Bacillariaceae sp.]